MFLLKQGWSCKYNGPYLLGVLLSQAPQKTLKLAATKSYIIVEEELPFTKFKCHVYFMEEIKFMLIGFAERMQHKHRHQSVRIFDSTQSSFYDLD